MIQKSLLLLTIFTTFLSYSQDRIKFEYDLAGNQIVRELCITCPSFKSTDEIVEDLTEIHEDKLHKFSQYDVISYYPNPVKEELFLKWELVNDNKVSKISIFSISGQLVKSINILEEENSNIISFNEYPEGTYKVLLFYTNGDQKSITIIKK